MSDRLFAAVSEAGVIHSGENLSNHSAIYSKVKVGSLDLTVETATPQQRSCWTKANEDAKANFKTTLASKLGEIQKPACVHCLDLKCQSMNHTESIEEYTMNVMEAMENAGSECLPTSGGVSGQGKKPNIAG